MRHLSIIALSTSCVLLGACSKPFPIEDALYAEYTAIVCKIPTGGMTPEILARQMELNKIFEDRLMKNGTPDVDWVKTHSLKLAEVMSLKTCSTASQTAIQATGNLGGGGTAVPTIGSQAKFDGVWHFNEEKSRAANVSNDEIVKAVVEGSIMAATIQTANSAGMKIQNGLVQDGTTRCTLEAASSQADKPVNCVNQANRSIVGEFSVSAGGDLIVNTQGIKLAFEKR
jgi:hypothetical protein